MSAFTQDELLAEVERALNEPPGDDLPKCEPGTITRGLLKRHLKITDHRATDLLHRLLDDGKIVPAMVNYIDAWGYKTRIRGYRLARENKDN